MSEGEWTTEKVVDYGKEQVKMFQEHMYLPACKKYEAELASAKKQIERYENVMSELAEFLVGYGDVAEIAARKLRKALSGETKCEIQK